jgi:hypothetical protein
MILMELFSSRPDDLVEIPSSEFQHMPVHVKGAAVAYKFDVDGVLYVIYFLQNPRDPGTYYFEYGVLNPERHKMQFDLVRGKDAALPFKVYPRVIEAMLRFLAARKPTRLMFLGFDDRQSEFYARMVPKLSSLVPNDYRVERLSTNLIAIVHADAGEEITESSDETPASTLVSTVKAWVAANAPAAINVELMAQNDTSVYLDNLWVPQEARGEGWGTKIMGLITQTAVSLGVTITLDPMWTDETQDPDFDLSNWYADFGFRSSNSGMIFDPEG